MIETVEQNEILEQYSAHGGTAGESGHFARICRTNQRLHTLHVLKQPCSKKTSDMEEVAPRETENNELLLRQSSRPSDHLDSHVKMQESLDGKVKKLVPPTHTIPITVKK